MLSREFLHALHNELQALTGKCPVLLGGSYVYGEPTDHSDVDFFVLVPWYRLFSFRRVIRDWKMKYPAILINIMIVQKMAFNLGWYYVYGRDSAGRLVRAPIHKQMMVMSALKLAYYNFLRFAASGDQKEKSLSQEKIAQKIAIIYTIVEHTGPTPPLATSRLIHYIPTDLEWVRASLVAKQKGNPILPISETTIIETLDRVFHHSRPYRCFSPATYLIYNLKFLPRGKTLFLWHNPDTMILQKIRRAIEKKSDLRQLLTELTPLIFPVIII